MKGLEEGKGQASCNLVTRSIDSQNEGTSALREAILVPFYAGLNSKKTALRTPHFSVDYDRVTSIKGVIC